MSKQLQLTTEGCHQGVGSARPSCGAESTSSRSLLCCQMGCESLVAPIVVRVTTSLCSNFLPNASRFTMNHSGTFSLCHKSGFALDPAGLSNGFGLATFVVGLSNAHIPPLPVHIATRKCLSSGR
eukprot:4490882-Amphidinium_carterae.1